MDKNATQNVPRRSFLRLLGWASLAAAVVAVVAVIVRMIFPNVTQEPPTDAEFDAGRADAMREGEVNLQFRDKKIFLVRDREELFALVAECTNDGCVPNWSVEDEVFMCPCCGSTFSKEGINLEGPASRPLERAAIRSGKGELFVDKSRRFRYEKGEWKNPGASVPV